MDITTSSGVMASGNIMAIKKALDSQEEIMAGLLNGMESNAQGLSTSSTAPTTGVNTSSTGGLDIRM